MSTIRLKHFKVNLVHLYILNTILETPELPHLKDSKEELLVLKKIKHNEVGKPLDLTFVIVLYLICCKTEFLVLLFDMLQNPISSSFGDF